MKQMASSILFFSYFVLFLTLFFSVDVVGADLLPKNRNIILQEFTRLNLPPEVASVGSLAFDRFERGPYTGTGDGRVFVYSKFTNSWGEYGFTTPNRNRTLCDRNTDYRLFPTCGFTSGLSFEPRSQNLYACDAYIGLTILGPRGGQAITVVRNSDGRPPFRFLNSVDVARDRNTYFTDASSRYDVIFTNRSIQTGDSTGRLLQFNPFNRQVTTLLSGLGRPAGVAISPDNRFLLVAENNKNRIQKYWLKGPNTGTSQIFLTFQGSPNKIKRNEEGDFWVAINRINANGVNAPQGVKFSPSGEILATVDLSREYQRRINTVLEQDKKLYIAANNISYVGQYKIRYTD